MISAEYPGCVPDIEIMKRHPEEVNRMLGVTRVLADKGYRGDPHVPNLVVVSHTNEAETRARLIVERFFGRLKNSFIVFKRTWELSQMRFSDYFNVACGLTNILITIAPLNFDDWRFNKEVFDRWAEQVSQRAARNKEKYERKKTARLYQQNLVSTMVNELLQLTRFNGFFYLLKKSCFEIIKELFHFLNYAQPLGNPQNRPIIGKSPCFFQKTPPFLHSPQNHSKHGQ